MLDEQGKNLPPSQADLTALQEQVDQGKVAAINDIYGGALVIPGVPVEQPGGLLNTVVLTYSTPLAYATVAESEQPVT